MNLEESKRLLAGEGLKLKSESRTGNDDGYSLRCTTGEIVNVFDSGRLSFQGKNQARMKELFEGTAPRIPSTTSHTSRKVFVVYGHDSKARTELEGMLRRWNCEPLILDQLPSEGLTIIEKLEKYATADVSFGVVLATPDDVGHAAGKESEMRGRARQNVVLELGMLLAKLGRPKVAILIRRQKDMERPSDIQGLIYIPFEDSVEDAKVQLAKEFDQQGIHVDVGKL